MAKHAKALGYTLVSLAAQGEPYPLRPCSSFHSASDALQYHRSHGLRGRAVPRTPRQPAQPAHSGSPAVAVPSKIPLTLRVKGLPSRGSSLGDCDRNGGFRSGRQRGRTMKKLVVISIVLVLV